LSAHSSEPSEWAMVRRPITGVTRPGPYRRSSLTLPAAGTRRALPGPGPPPRHRMPRGIRAAGVREHDCGRCRPAQPRSRPSPGFHRRYGPKRSGANELHSQSLFKVSQNRATSSKKRGIPKEKENSGRTFFEIKVEESFLRPGGNPPGLTRPGTWEVNFNGNRCTNKGE